MFLSKQPYGEFSNCINIEFLVKICLKTNLKEVEDGQLLINLK